MILKFVNIGLTQLLGKLWLNRQELTAEDFDLAESSKNEGILYVFPVFRTERIRQKIRRSAADDLFRVSFDTLFFSIPHIAPGGQLFFPKKTKNPHHDDP